MIRFIASYSDSRYVCVSSWFEALKGSYLKIYMYCIVTCALSDRSSIVYDYYITYLHLMKMRVLNCVMIEEEIWQKICSHSLLLPYWTVFLLKEKSKGHNVIIVCKKGLVLIFEHSPGYP